MINSIYWLSALLIVIIIVVVTVFYFHYHPLFIITFWSKIPPYNGKYGTYIPEMVLNDELRMRGQPTHIDKSYGGNAKWIINNLIINVTDSPQPSEDPKQLKIVSYSLPIKPTDKWIQQLESIPFQTLFSYDKKTNILTVYGDFSGQCQALLYILIEDQSKAEKFIEVIDKVRDNPGIGFDYEHLVLKSSLISNESQ